VSTGEPFFSAGFFAEGFFSTGFWGDQPSVPASLGAWGPVEQRKKPRKRLDDDLEVEESLPDATVARLTKEMLAASLSADMADRARTRSRRMRAEEEALLLMI
jgi:hypothetical protein